MERMIIATLTILSLVSCTNDESQTQVYVHILPSEIQSKMQSDAIIINHYNAQNTFSTRPPKFSTTIDRAESFSSAEDLPNRPFGAVIIRPNGYISFATDDYTSKRSYISCAIENVELEELGATFAFRWNSTTNRVDETPESTLLFDEKDKRYYALGPKSDGSLTKNAKKAAAKIRLKNDAKNNMRVRDCVIGWLDTKD